MNETTFMAILPQALAAMQTERRRRHQPPFAMGVLEYHADGQKTSAKRYCIQGTHDHTRINPLTAAAWFWKMKFFDVSNDRAAARELNLDSRFTELLLNAIWHHERFDRQLRRRLLETYGISLQYLEPAIR